MPEETATRRSSPLRKILLALVILLAAWLAWEAITFPDVEELRDQNPETTAFMEHRRRELRRAGKDADLQYRFVPYDRISRHLRRGVLVSEDNSFYEHEGVDVEGMKEAMRRNWEERRLTAGGSTITQQLAKNLYLSPSRNPVRKLKEFLIARSMERNLSKKRILELYLNVVEMGERVYGAEAAARHYFGKSAAGLTPSQAALLAGCLPNPRVMNPADPNSRLRARQRIILSRMERWGHLVEEEMLTERRKPDAAPPTPTEAVEPDIEMTDTINPADSPAPIDPASEEPTETAQEEPPEGAPTSQSPPEAEPEPPPEGDPPTEEEAI
ncbi:MAG TPA: monofunctional biosynthetic peptidoglycan transglycosylase [Thermoanaerobaculia bacterium]|nr:monofunctional biosynthetic peptidoglycan transglycosylase [Thermoanaerobaculia bacterium]